jgi:hypothetical protein
MGRGGCRMGEEGEVMVDGRSGGGSGSVRYLEESSPGTKRSRDLEGKKGIQGLFSWWSDRYDPGSRYDDRTQCQWTTYLSYTRLPRLDLQLPSTTLLLAKPKTPRRSQHQQRL